MKDESLLNQIQSSGISLEQSIKSFSIISEVAKQKFPILEGTINLFLKKEFKEIDSGLIEKILGSNE